MPLRAPHRELCYIIGRGAQSKVHALSTANVIFDHLRMAQKTYDVAEAPKRTASREAGSTRK